MYSDENYVKITKMDGDDSIEIHESYVRLREGQNKLMALNVKAPLFETAEIQRFFEGSDSSEKLMVNISATGDFGVKFRGIIDGKEKNFSQNMDHIIILFEQYNCFATYTDAKGFPNSCLEDISARFHPLRHPKSPVPSFF